MLFGQRGGERLAGLVGDRPGARVLVLRRSEGGQDPACGGDLVAAGVEGLGVAAGGLDGVPQLGQPGGAVGGGLGEPAVLGRERGGGLVGPGERLLGGGQPPAVRGEVLRRLVQRGPFGLGALERLSRGLGCEPGGGLARRAEGLLGGAQGGLGVGRGTVGRGPGLLGVPHVRLGHRGVRGGGRGRVLGRAAHGARLAGHEPLRQFGGGLLVPGTQQTDVPFGGLASPLLCLPVGPGRGLCLDGAGGRGLGGRAASGGLGHGAVHGLPGAETLGAAFDGRAVCRDGRLTLGAGLDQGGAVAVDLGPTLRRGGRLLLQLAHPVTVPNRARHRLRGALGLPQRLAGGGRVGGPVRPGGGEPRRRGRLVLDVRQGLRHRLRRGAGGVRRRGGPLGGREHPPGALMGVDGAAPRRGGLGLGVVVASTARPRLGRGQVPPAGLQLTRRHPGPLLRGAGRGEVGPRVLVGATCALGGEGEQPVVRVR